MKVEATILDVQIAEVARLALVRIGHAASLLLDVVATKSKRETEALVAMRAPQPFT